MNVSPNHFLAAVFVLALSPPALARQSDAPAGRVDLSGTWDDAGDKVVITDGGGTVTAQYAKQKDCRFDGVVTPY